MVNGREGNGTLHNQQIKCSSTIRLSRVVGPSACECEAQLACRRRENEVRCPSRCASSRSRIWPSQMYAGVLMSLPKMTANSLAGSLSMSETRDCGRSQERPHTSADCDLASAFCALT
eukprot:1667573-Pleurochrysis_carterae.AAC.3